MAFPFLLLASAAAGIGGNAIMNEAENMALNEKGRLINIGADLERQEIDVRMNQEELAFSEYSLESMKRLREVMSAQSAIFGARNQKQGTGSALTIKQKGFNEYNAEQRALNLSKSFKKLQLENQKSISRLHQMASQNKISNYKTTRALKQNIDLFNKGLNMFTQSFGMMNG